MNEQPLPLFTFSTLSIDRPATKSTGTAHRQQIAVQLFPRGFALACS